VPQPFSLDATQIRITARTLTACGYSLGLRQRSPADGAPSWEEEAESPQNLKSGQEVAKQEIFREFQTRLNHHETPVNIG
jgi:hypothetical protein